MEKSGIYIHIPFCAGKCVYCDFFSAGVSQADWPRYVRALLNELEERKNELRGDLSTLYIGGGTPSLMDGEAFAEMAEGIRRITEKRDSWEEFTIEVNPEDVNEARCIEWRLCGVNRISMGVQSFVDSELRSVRRRHDSRKAIAAAKLLRKHFDNISLDLIFGLPGQIIESWKESVETALSLNPDHISAYSMMLEPGTPLTVLAEQGRVVLPDENTNVEMFRYLTEHLSTRGYVQYEISNYARVGYESRHNRRYWLGNPYIGLGPGAHSYDGERIRRSNPTQLREYLERFDTSNSSRDGETPPFYKEEVLTDDELMEERIMLAMRTREGLDMKAFSLRFGEEAGRAVMQSSITLAKQKLVENNNGHVRLTPEGVMLSDDVILRLVP